MGFAIVDPQLPAEWASTLKLKATPEVRMILPVLRKNPPKDTATARRWFDILGGRLSGKVTFCKYSSP